MAALAARAAVEGWPITADHCFLRVAYDNAVGARWDLAYARPGWRSLPIDRLAAAVAVVMAIDSGGVPVLRRLNAASLVWRRARRIDAAQLHG